MSIATECPRCGAAIQATEVVKIDYDNLTVRFESDGTVAIVDDLTALKADWYTTELYTYCANDCTAEQMIAAAKARRIGMED